MPPPGGYSLIGPKRLVCVAERLFVFRVLSIKQGIQFHFSVLNRVSFSTGSLYESVRVGNKQCAFVVSTIFFQKNIISCY